jgi:hypothetical protein
MAAGASFLLLVLLLVALIVGVVVVVLLAASRRKRVAQPSCGACRYPVAGLEVLRCPECGADLRTVGILTPANSGPSRRMIATLLVVAWTLVLPVPAIYATMIVGRAVTIWTTSATATMTPRAPSHPYTVDVMVTGSHPPWAVSFDEARITAIGPGGQRSAALGVHLDGDRAVLPAADGQPERSGPFDAAIVQAWMDRAGVGAAEGSVDPIAASGEAQGIVDTVRSLAATSAAATGPAFSSVSVRSSSRRALPLWFPPVAIAFWLAVWSAVVLLIVRWARRSATARA